jgi:hypothetical protein
MKAQVSTNQREKTNENKPKHIHEKKNDNNSTKENIKIN